MQTSNQPSNAGRNALILVLGLAVVAIFAYSMVGLSNQRKRADELASTNQSLRDTLAKMQDQLQSVTSRLDTIAEPKTPPALAQPKPAPVSW